jgi:hypothetical protein
MAIEKKPCKHEWVEVVPGTLKCKKCGAQMKTGSTSSKTKK